ncbi:MAG: nitrilase-related carbon-nitrogen hydrolase [Planctomycetota bacterium]
MRIALAQFNPVVGDITGNCEKMAEYIARAADLGAELCVFCELSAVGYPPRDLLGKEQFVADSVAAVDRLASKCTDIACWPTARCAAFTSRRCCRVTMFSMRQDTSSLPWISAASTSAAKGSA